MVILEIELLGFIGEQLFLGLGLIWVEGKRGYGVILLFSFVDRLTKVGMEWARVEWEEWAWVFYFWALVIRCGPGLFLCFI